LYKSDSDVESEKLLNNLSHK